MQTLFLKLLNMSISATWLVLAVVALRLLLKRAPKAVTCVLWALVAVRLVCPFSIESVLSLIPSAEPLPPAILYDPAPTVQTGIDFVNQAINPAFTASFAPDALVSVNPLQVATFAASWVWVTGMAVMAAYALVSYLRLRNKVSAGLAQEENIVLCDYIDTPFILGVFRPRIYLPSAMTEESRTYVIAHEKAHLKRRDHWWKPLGYALLTVYWFNPAMWLAYILLCRDIELACDEKVIREMDAEDKRAYSAALLSCSISRRSIAACPLAFGEVGVKERVRSVLHYKKPAFWIILVSVIACAAMAVCFLTDPKQPESPTEGIYDGVVTKVEETYITIGPADDPHAETIRIMIDELTPPLAVGDIVQVVHSGEFDTTVYPREFKSISYIYEVDEEGNILSTVRGYNAPTLDEVIADYCDQTERMEAEEAAMEEAAVLLEKLRQAENSDDAQLERAEQALQQARQRLFDACKELEEISEVCERKLAESYEGKLISITSTYGGKVILAVDQQTGEVLAALSMPTQDRMNLEKWLQTVCQRPNRNATAEDCIAEHPEQYRALLDMGQDTLEYCFLEFLMGEQDELKAEIMARVCQDTMTRWSEEDLVEPDFKGQAWFNVFRRSAWWLQEELTDEQIQAEHPAAWAFIHMFDGADYSDCSFAAYDFSGITRAVLTNINNRSTETQITNSEDIEEIISFLRSLTGEDGESSRGYLECNYWLTLYRDEVEVLSIGFGASPGETFHYGVYPDGYATRWHLEDMTSQQVTEFLQQFDSSIQ